MQKLQTPAMFVKTVTDLTGQEGCSQSPGACKNIYETIKLNILKGKSSPKSDILSSFKCFSFFWGKQDVIFF